MEAARLLVTVGVDGMNQLVSDMSRGEAAVDAFGNSKATAVVGQAGADEVVSKLEHTRAIVEEVGRAKAEPTVHVRGVDEGISALDRLRAKLGSLSRSGFFGSIGQDLNAGLGLRSALSFGAGTIGMGLRTGGIGGAIGAVPQVIGAGGMAILGGVTAAATIGGIALAKAGEMEKYETQLSVLLGGMDKAKKRMAELVEFGATTPFELPEVVQASKTLQVFAGDALSTGDGLRLIGDVAAGTGSQFGEIAMWFGRMYDAMKSGRPFGEATMRLQELGAIGGKSREVIESLAAKVKDGSMTMEQAWELASAEFGRFSGMMDKQSQTLEGKMSNLSDAIGQTFAKLGVLLLPAAKVVVDTLIAGITTIGNVFGTIKDVIDGIASGAENVVDWFRDIEVGGHKMGTVFDDFFDTLGRGWQRAGDLTEEFWATMDAGLKRLQGKDPNEIDLGGTYVKGLMDKARHEIEKKPAANPVADAIADIRFQALLAKIGISGLADVIADKLFGDRIDKGRVEELKGQIAELKAALEETPEGTRKWKIIDGQLASTQQQLWLLQFQMKQEEGPKALYDWLKKQSKTLSTLDQDTQDLIQRLLRLYGIMAQPMGVRLFGTKATRLLDIGERAVGGPVSPNRPYVIGEKGPEIFWPDSAGTVIPNVGPPQVSPMWNTIAQEHANERALIAIGTIHVDARGATDPEAVRRAGRRGVMDAVAEGYRQQNARLPQASR